MKGEKELRKILNQIDGRGYKAYNRLEGVYKLGNFVLFIEHVQRDPFAVPSQLRVEIDLDSTGIPEDLYSTFTRKVALEDFISRTFQKSIKSLNINSEGSGNSGLIYIDAGGQEILERSCVNINHQYLEIRFQLGLPAQGRRIRSRTAQKMLLMILPKIVDKSCFYCNLSQIKLTNQVDSFEDMNLIQEELENRELVAFIGNGSLLPRRSGVSELPLEEGIQFKSPESMETSFETIHNGTIKGMGIPEGITLIIGGGYHGKTTLLQAIEKGVYPHILGDGREWVITRKDAVKIRAEDGRRIEKVDISSFIHNPPLEQDTHIFSSKNASGSTSQAANIIEALEAGSRLLLFDEDTSATNFMIRDERMQLMVSKEKEPIIPFIDRVEELYQERNVSSILVMGGSGAYLDVAHQVIMLDHFRPYNVTEKAKLVSDKLPVNRRKEITGNFSYRKRIPYPDSIKVFKGHKKKIKSRGLHTIFMGKYKLDLSQVEQLIDPSQTRFLAQAMYHAKKYFDQKRTLPEILDLVEEDLDREGLVVIYSNSDIKPSDIARARKYELSAAFNRLRSLRICE